LATAEASIAVSTSGGSRAAWIRVCHWLIAAGVITLAVSGFLILMVHPRLYWGDIGNDLTPALLELPISDNHRPEGWQVDVTFSDLTGAPVSGIRTYDADIFNENGWARSLHFLAGWVFVIVGALYAAAAVVTRHFWRDLWPRRGGSYSLLQRSAYTAVAFVVLPFMVLAGLAMSPQVVAAFPVLHAIVGGHQSARTLHFFGFVVIGAFVVGHVAMAVLSNSGKNMRAMIVGR